MKACQGKVPKPAISPPTIRRWANDRRTAGKEKKEISIKLTKRSAASGGSDTDVGLPGEGAEARLIAAHNPPLGEGPANGGHAALVVTDHGPPVEVGVGKIVLKMSEGCGNGSGKGKKR